jgi:lipopolysaccharide/colanic/teichoic acid biosynthesis glycosyltransferase
MRDLSDRIIAALALLIGAPVLLAVGVCVALADGRPILFWQTRIGRKGRPFRLAKFRSMRPEYKPATQMRRYKLDELPQMWNVLRGDMSLVGPRPEVPAFVDVTDPTWRKVLSVRPGLTDLATLVYRKEEELLAAVSDPEQYYRDVVLPDKLQLNVRYLERRTLLSDLQLLIVTVCYAIVPGGFDSARIKAMFFAENVG